MAFSTFTGLGNHPLYPVPKHMDHPERESGTRQATSPCRPPRGPSGRLSAFCLAGLASCGRFADRELPAWPCVRGFHLAPATWGPPPRCVRSPLLRLDTIPPSGASTAGVSVHLSADIRAAGASWPLRMFVYDYVSGACVQFLVPTYGGVTASCGDTTCHLCHFGKDCHTSFHSSQTASPPFYGRQDKA